MRRVSAVQFDLFSFLFGRNLVQHPWAVAVHGVCNGGGLWGQRLARARIYTRSSRTVYAPAMHPERLRGVAAEQTKAWDTFSGYVPHV